MTFVEMNKYMPPNGWQAYQKVLMQLYGIDLEDFCRTFEKLVIVELQLACGNKYYTDMHRKFSNLDLTQLLLAQ